MFPEFIVIRGAKEHDLKKVDITLPRHKLIELTGVSGSGKSSLVVQTLQPLLVAELHRAKDKPGVHERLEGREYVNKVVNITQDPIGRTPRSNPATYVKVWGSIRGLLPLTPDAKLRASAGKGGAWPTEPTVRPARPAAPSELLRRHPWGE